MRKKGFTLIELLAVIIILAIVALIATPIVLDVIEDARISAGRSEANMILGGINNYCANEEMKAQLNPNYTRICTSDMDEDDVPTMVNLGNATIDKIVYNGDKLTELEITSNNHKFTLCPSGTFAMDDEECEGNNGDVALEGVSIKSVAESLVYENGVCKSEGTYQYMGGCYIKNIIHDLGTDMYGHPILKGEPVENNYIWYSGFLWRIMGINADGTVRMITEDNVTSIPWGASDTAENWDGSHAKDWLNNYFYPRLKGNNIIKETTWCSETTTSGSSARTTCITNLSAEPAKVGLLTLDEYNLAGGTNSYLNIAQNQWTMTPYSSSYVRLVSSDGHLTGIGLTDAYGIRAVINVNSNVTITGGNGTLGDSWSSETGPYILNEDKNVEVTGKLNEKATSGEYVLFAGRKYRVVDKDSNGNTKLILDSYYEETEGTVYTMSYGSNNTFSKDTGIGQKLNSDVLNWLTNNSESEKAKLVSDYTWYQNNFASGQSYSVSLNEENPTRSIQATVGLIRVGEMLSGQSSSILTKGYTTASSYSNAKTYWTMTPYTSSSSAWRVNDIGLAGNVSVTFTNGLRAVIVVNSDVTITGGNGTWSSPYEI